MYIGLKYRYEVAVRVAADCLECVCVGLRDVCVAYRSNLLCKLTNKVTLISSLRRPRCMRTVEL